jgi:hypothetical protein
MAGYGTLWLALEQSRWEPPDDLEDAIAALPPPGNLPSPWVTWTLIGLVRHRRRQQFVTEVVDTRLRGLRTSSSSGLVPGLTDWEYAFHGRGCLLTHRGTGLRIDLDFYDPPGEYIDFYFYRDHLQSLREPEPPEERLIALHRSLEPIRLAVADLRTAGFLVPLEGGPPHVFRIAPAVLDHEAAIAAFCQAWGPPAARPWLAALVGDWPAAAAAPPGLEGSAGDNRIAERAATCRGVREYALRHRGDPDRSGVILQALDDLGAASLDEHLQRTLEGPPSSASARALEIITRRGGTAWCPSLRRLLLRLDPERELPEPTLWVACLGFLLRHDARAGDLRGLLAQAAGLALAEAALLALEFAPEEAPGLFSRALRSEIPLNRIAAAAALAVLNQPWSRRELIAVLRESRDWEPTAECRAALQECPADEARAALQEWEEANPGAPETEPNRDRPITLRDSLLQSTPRWVQSQMSRLHERVQTLRARSAGQAAS